MSEIQAIAPEILVVLVGALLPLVGTFGVPRRALATLSGGAILLAGVLVAATVFDVPGLESYRAAAQGLPLVGGAPTAFGVLEITAFAALFKLVFLGVALFVVLASPSYMASSRHQGEYYGLLLLATVGMMVVASSRDLVTLFVAFETTSIATFALVAFFKDTIDGSEAAMKYFIVGALSAALTLFGISIFYGLTGSVAFDVIGNVARAQPTFGGAPLAVFGWGFLLAGFGFKIALVPFHMWAVDTYDGAPSPVSAILAAGSKQMGFIALFKLFLIALLASKAHWDVLVAIVAVVTMTVGNLLALNQESLKRMLAYSSIAQAGYILIAIPIAGAGGDAATFALVGAFFHIVTYAVMKAGAFLAVGAVAAEGVPDTFEAWRGLGRKAPFVGLVMTAFMLSFVGIPPLAGFASKFILFSAAVQAGSWYVWLAVAGILNSALSLFYYLRVVRTLYVDEGAPVSPYAPTMRLAWGAMAALLITAFLTVLFGVWPQPIVEFSADAVAGILPALGAP
ncbi:MAG TPA: NADH-quinone oxidoreductase subunit N [Candidatus Thermoplasmatota archaeon]|nr:NADH-quinone oxidoreductase subunit N [Candidatus Thermoplasmatota archaeon]